MLKWGLAFFRFTRLLGRRIPWGTRERALPGRMGARKPLEDMVMGLPRRPILRARLSIRRSFLVNQSSPACLTLFLALYIVARRSDMRHIFANRLT